MLFIIISIALGLFVGSFINVVIDRSFVDEDYVSGRSHCDYCGHTLRPIELIPIFSWVIQRGKSLCCNKRLSLQHPFIELLSAIGSGIVVSLTLHAYEPSVYLLVVIFLRLILYWICLIIFISDYKYQLIPFSTLLAGVFVSCMHLITMAYMTQSPILEYISSYVIWAVIASGILFFLWLITKGKAMGDGDIYLAGIIGLLVGFPGTIVALYAAFLTGACVGVILVLRQKKSLKTKIAFGPFLLIGLCIASLWGHILFSAFGF